MHFLSEKCIFVEGSAVINNAFSHRYLGRCRRLLGRGAALPREASAAALADYLAQYRGFLAEQERAAARRGGLVYTEDLAEIENAIRQIREMKKEA